ncbi:hypothetical protein Dsin_021868 [Dipteronia sinensis]|uniref:PHD finger protein ALFIN-LIKE n=1 Tax=Dipteronia sinensis TaxID=43782 RepID=A0AAE0A0P8_9ROSI|nr:hypothetical protein Dsin_021868 [Dipteronia sinensis]
MEYGLPNETWEVNLPVEKVPSDLPEPALGLNFARDGMQEKDWLQFTVIHGCILFWCTLWGLVRMKDAFWAMGEGCLHEAHDPKQIREGEGRMREAQSGQYLLGGSGLLQMVSEPGSLPGVDMDLDL